MSHVLVMRSNRAPNCSGTKLTVATARGRRVDDASPISSEAMTIIRR